MEKFLEDRIWHGYLLADYGNCESNNHNKFNPCDLCELCETCDRLADDLNNIEYCMCLSKGAIKDVEYKTKHPNAYFKFYDKNKIFE